MDHETFRADVQRLYSAWSRGSGVSQFCGDVLRAVHRGEGSVEFSALPSLDQNNWGAVSRILHAKWARQIPMEGIRDFVTEDQFRALFDLEIEPDRDAGPSI